MALIPLISFSLSLSPSLSLSVSLGGAPRGARAGAAGKARGRARAAAAVAGRGRRQRNGRGRSPLSFFFSPPLFLLPCPLRLVKTAARAICLSLSLSLCVCVFLAWPMVNGRASGGSAQTGLPSPLLRIPPSFLLCASPFPPSFSRVQRGSLWSQRACAQQSLCPQALRSGPLPSPLPLSLVPLARCPPFVYTSFL